MNDHKFIYHVEPKLAKRIISLFDSLALPTNLSGYEYLASAVAIAVEDPSTIYAVTKKIYPDIAKLYDTNIACVEAAIRNAIDTSWLIGDADFLYSIFGHTVRNSSGRPSDAEYIAMVSSKLIIDGDTMR